MRIECAGLGRSLVLAIFGGVVASLVLAMLVLLLSGDAHAEPPAEHSGALHVRTADGRVIRHAPRLNTEATLHVNGMLARVQVRQRFVNPAPEWVEAVYVFPLPDDSAVDHMRMRAGGRVIEGEIQEKAQARRTYQQARQQGQRASLLEQERPNIFTTSVANVPPGGEVEVEIEYQQAVQHRDGLFSLRFPMVVGPRYIPATPIVERSEGFGDAGWGQGTAQVPDAARITPPLIDSVIEQAYSNPVSLSVELDAGLPIGLLESPYHALAEERQDAARRHLTLADGAVPADRDFVLQWRLAQDKVPDAALFQEQWQGDHYGLLMVNPPAAQQIDQAQLPARELILVVDTSGSMHGDSIEQARAALLLALQRLRPSDYLNIIQFNDQMAQLFDGAVPADAANLALARRYVQNLVANGGTEMQPAMQHALASPGRPGLLRQVVFLTDGAIGNEQALFDTIQARLGDSRLFPVGIGSAPNSYFMTRAAAFGRGSFTFIGRLDEVAQRMQGLFERLSQPVLTDIRVHWQGGSEVQQTPQRVPDLYAGEPLLLSVRSKGALDAVVLEGQLGDRPWRREIQLRGGANAQGVHVLWARRGIEQAMARLGLGDGEQAVRSEVLGLALAHHLVSKYTSLVAVDKTPARPADSALLHKQVPTHLPAGWSQAHVVGMPQTATPAMLHSLLGLLLLLASGLVWRRRA